MKQYNVTGMNCAACSARVERAVSAVSGVTSCSVNLLTNSMGVEGEASEQDIIAAVEKAGYGASLKGTERRESADTTHQQEEKSNQGNQKVKNKIDQFRRIFAYSYVFFDGAYDVGLAASILL